MARSKFGSPLRTYEIAVIRPLSLLINDNDTLVSRNFISLLSDRAHSDPNHEDITLNLSPNPKLTIIPFNISGNEVSGRF